MEGLTKAVESTLDTYNYTKSCFLIIFVGYVQDDFGNIGFEGLVDVYVENGNYAL